MSFLATIIIEDFQPAKLQLKSGGGVIDEEDLTPPLTKGRLRAESERQSRAGLTQGQDFDTLAIVALDKIIRRNKIDKLSLKSMEIRGETASEAVKFRIAETICVALKL